MIDVQLQPQIRKALASTDSPKAARACPRRFQASPVSGFACIAYARSSQVKLHKKWYIELVVWYTLVKSAIAFSSSLWNA